METAPLSTFAPNLFANRTVLVTGGGRGIGREIALAFAGLGADVIIASRNADNLVATARDIEALGRRCVAQVTNVRKPEEVDALVAAALAQFGKIDFLINNAGGQFPARPARHQRQRLAFRRRSESERHVERHEPCRQTHGGTRLRRNRQHRARLFVRSRRAAVRALRRRARGRRQHDPFARLLLGAQGRDDQRARAGNDRHAGFARRGIRQVRHRTELSKTPYWSTFRHTGSANRPRSPRSARSCVRRRRATSTVHR